MPKNRILALVCGVLAIPLTLAYADSCFTAKAVGTQTPSPLSWSAILVLDTLETKLDYNVACCGCGTQGVQARVYSDDEGFLFALSGLGGHCPIEGQWTSTDPVPLTPQRVQALKDGKLYLLLWQPTCHAEFVQAHLTPESCEE